jgi:hypothetical protein
VGEFSKRVSLREALKLGLVVLGAALSFGVALSVTGPMALPVLHSISSDPQPLLRQAERAIGAQAELDQEGYAPIVRLIDRAPLAAEPFAILGLAASRTADLARAERLLTEARRRNPRSKLARLGLMGIYYRTERVFLGSREVVVLSRLDRDARNLLVFELARLASDPRNIDAMVRALGEDPILDDVLLYMAQGGSNPDLIMRLAAGQPASTTGDFRPWQGMLIRTLADSGQAKQAYALWRRFARLPEGQPPLIYDPDFKGLPGAPPFNWDLLQGGAGTAQPTTNGLEVQYYGRANATLARQLLMLPPGAYRFSVHAEGDASGEGGKLAWRLYCQRTETNLFDLPLEDLNYPGDDIATEFSVPTNCPEQWLQLEGRIAEFPESQQALMSNLRLSRSTQGR